MRHYFAETSFLLVNASIPTFDEDGILNGMGIVDCIYLPDEVTIDGVTIKIPGSEISELSVE